MFRNINSNGQSLVSIHQAASAIPQAHVPARSHAAGHRGIKSTVTHLQSICSFLYHIYVTVPTKKNTFINPDTKFRVHLLYIVKQFINNHSGGSISDSKNTCKKADAKG